MLTYNQKMIQIYKIKFREITFKFWHRINNILLKTYRPKYNFTRCDDCGRDVHDFYIDSSIWLQVCKQEETLCYDCFCARSDICGIDFRGILVSNKEIKKNEG